MRKFQISGIILTVLIFILLTVVVVLSGIDSPRKSTNATTGAQVVAVPTVAPPQPTSVPTIGTGYPDVTLNSPQIQVGQIIEMPANLVKQGQLTLKQADKSAKITLTEAFGAVPTDWATGGQYKGKQVTVQVSYGLATFGKREADGGWSGYKNIPIYTCVKIRECTRTGQTLERIEDRLMWILDYKNITFSGGNVDYNHSVLAVDDETGLKMFGWGYNE